MATRSAWSRRRSVALSSLMAGMLTLAATGCTTLDGSELDSASYTSTGGSDHGRAVEWLHSRPLTLAFESLNGGPTAVLGTPCNTVNMPVAVHGRELVPDTADMVVTARGCLGEAGAQEHWATAFFSRTMTISRSGRTLTLTTDDAEIRFRR